MRATSKNVDMEPERKLAIDTKELQEMLGCGRYTAYEIGTMAGARMQFGKRVLWNVAKIKAYLECISE
ncbi:MAG: hypothetical protein IJU80_05950 [Lachnospiraceae bacterium]|nr:hypothetical protein [Lachnospiraceae bacterium]